MFFSGICSENLIFFCCFTTWDNSLYYIVGEVTKNTRIHLYDTFTHACMHIISRLYVERWIRCDESVLLPICQSTNCHTAATEKLNLQDIFPTEYYRILKTPVKLLTVDLKTNNSITLCIMNFKTMKLLIFVKPSQNLEMDRDLQWATQHRRKPGSGKTFLACTLSEQL